MIFIALFIHLIGHYLIIGFSKTRLKELRNQTSWKLVLFELAGVFTNFLISFIIIITIGLTSNEIYLLNENAIYGIKCSTLMKETGFKDGDKIISINNQKIDRFSEIIPKMIFQSGETFVKVIRDSQEIDLNIPISKKVELMNNDPYELLAPKLTPNFSSEIKPKQLVYSETPQGFVKSIKTFNNAFKIANEFIFPHKYKEGYLKIKKITSLESWFYLVAVFSILIGLINLLPFPGLDVGNSIIALIEKRRKRKFNRKIMIPIKIGCIVVLTALIFTKIYFM